MICKSALFAMTLMSLTYVAATSTASASSARRRRGSQSQRAMEASYSGHQQASDESSQLSPYFASQEAYPQEANISSAGAQIGTAFIYSDENDLAQDPTAFGLFDSSILDQPDLTSLHGQALLDYYYSIKEASRPLFHYMSQLRMTSIEEGKLVGPLIASTIEQKGDDVDFTLYAHTKGTFAEYGTPLLDLGSQNRLLRGMDKIINKLRHKFSNDDHLFGQEEEEEEGESHAALIGIKKDVNRFEKIVEEIRRWTNPGSLCQVHQLIKLYGHDKAQDYIHREEAYSEHIANLYL